MTTELFQTLVLIISAATLLGVGGILVWIFNLGQWKGRIDAQFEGNWKDHERYDEVFHGAGR